MNSNPVKIFQVYGRIEKELPPLRFTKDFYLEKDYFDFSKGVWSLAVKDLTIQSDYLVERKHNSLPNAWFEKFFVISTNFVQGQHTQSLDRTNIPLATFRYQEWGNQIIYFSPQIWFQINNPSRHFKVDIKPAVSGYHLLPAGYKLDNSFYFTLTFMFQRIQ